MRARRLFAAARRRTIVVLAAVFRAHAAAAGASGASITIPATCAVGDVVAMGVITSTVVTVTTPTGWTLRDTQLPSSGKAYLFSKTLVSGEPGSAVAINGATKTAAAMTAFSGATEASLQFIAVVDASTSAPALPVLAAVPLGAGIAGFFLRRRAGSPAPDFTTLPTGWSQGSNNRGASTGGTPEVGAEAVYRIADVAGSYGGEAVAMDNASIGVQWLIAFPAGSPLGGAALDGGLPSDASFSRTVDGGVPSDTVFATTYDGGSA